MNADEKETALVLCLVYLRLSVFIRG